MMKELITLEDLKENYSKARKRLEDYKNRNSPKDIIDKCFRERIIRELDSLLFTYSMEGIGRFKISFPMHRSYFCMESLESKEINELLIVSKISVHAGLVTQITLPEDVYKALNVCRYSGVTGETYWNYLIDRIKKHFSEIGLTLIKASSWELEYEY